MDKIVKKLKEGGVSHDIIEELKLGLGNTFETELITNGLKMAAEKIGIDTTHLPHVDLTNLVHTDKECIKQDGEKEIGFLTKIKNFFIGK